MNAGWFWERTFLGSNKQEVSLIARNQLGIFAAAFNSPLTTYGCHEICHENSFEAFIMTNQKALHDIT